MLTKNLSNNIEVSIIQPIILFSGYGTRLRANLSGPKGLAKVYGRTLLGMQLDKIKDYLRTPIVVVNRTEAPYFMDFLSCNTDYKVILVEEESPQSPSSSALQAWSVIPKSVSHALIMLGDSLTESSDILFRSQMLLASDEIGFINASASSEYNKGSRVIVEKNGYLHEVFPKTKIGRLRWSGVVCMPKGWLLNFNSEESLIHQVGKLGRKGLRFKIVEERGAFINVNTMYDLLMAREVFTS